MPITNKFSIKKTYDGAFPKNFRAFLLKITHMGGFTKVFGLAFSAKFRRKYITKVLLSGCSPPQKNSSFV